MRQQLQKPEGPQIPNLGPTMTPSTTGHNHIAPVSNFDMYAWQRSDHGIDSRYAAGSIDSSHLGLPDTIRPHSIVPQHRLDLHSTPPISTPSSIPHDQQPTQNLDKRVIPAKRSRSSEGASTPPLPDDQRQLVNRIGAPENLFGVSRLNSIPSNKRSRTLYQKQNKKDVLSIGGSCFLCRYDNKVVRFSPFPYLCRTNSSGSALVFYGHVRLVEITGPTNQQASSGPVFLAQN